MKYASKNTYFKDVHVFLDRVKNIVTIKNVDLVRSNLFTCLRDQILIWYISKLTDEKRRLLKYKNNLDKWITFLIAQFRKFFVKIMKVIIDERYIIQDARRKRESREYAQTIVKIAKSTKLSIYNQLQIIWNDLDIKFQQDLFMSKNNITLNIFLKNLNNRKEIWRRLAKSRHYNNSLSKQKFK